MAGALFVIVIAVVEPPDAGFGVVCGCAKAIG